MANGTIAFDTLTTSDSVNTGTEKSIDTSYIFNGVAKVWIKFDMSSSFTNEDSIILDPVCGSGTTGFVADKLNRKCFLIDINQEVVPIIQKRFQDKIYNI